MRLVIGFVLLFVVAVVAASLLGTNDGLVTFSWRAWRVELSLNLFLLLLGVGGIAAVSAVLALRSLLTLPQRAREWRTSRRDRVAQAALREALSQSFGGRYSRSQRAAQRALAVQADTPDLPQDNDFSVLALLLAAGSAHRLQDRAGRDACLQQALDISGRSLSARSAQEGVRLLAAEWALDDRDVERALDQLGLLTPGAARRTQALRLRLAANRLARQPLEALRTARLLAKHQGFSRTGAQGLLRSLAIEVLEGARDIDQLRRAWQQLDGADRRDAWVGARGAQRAAELGGPGDGRGWLVAFWTDLPSRPADERAVLCAALIRCVDGVGADWLPRVEAAVQSLPADAPVVLAAGLVCLRCGVIGVARRHLGQAASDESLEPALRRRAWRELAEQALADGDDLRARQAIERAAAID